MQKGDFVCAPCRRYFNAKPKTPSEVAVADCNSALDDNVSEMQITVGTDHSYTSFTTQEEGKVGPGSSAPLTYSNATALPLNPSDSHAAGPSKGRDDAAEPKANSRISFKQEAIRLITESKYCAALRVMYNAPNRAVKAAFRNFLTGIISSEIRAYSSMPSSKSPFASDFNHTNVSFFNWTDTIADAQRVMPMTVTAISALFPNARQVSKQVMVGRKAARRYWAPSGICDCYACIII